MLQSRTIKEAMLLQAKKYPILALTGPRQSGKTTFLIELFEDYDYVSLEDIDTRTFAENDPRGFLNQYNNKVIFDEVQQVPSLFSYLQTKMDKDKIMGQYILSGSQNFLLIQNISQSLAGRIALFQLFPFDIIEMKQANLLAPDAAQVLINGFYPAIYDRNIEQKVFYSNYIKTYLEKDVSLLMNVHDIRKFRNFLLLCAGRAAQLLNLSELARDANISQPTAKAWLGVLESSYITFQLQPYHKNFNKRVMKSPKLFFYDTGLVCHLLRINKPETLQQSKHFGNLFENFALAERIKQNAHLYLHHDFSFFRDSEGKEVDLITETDNGIIATEIKATKTITQKLFSGLNFFENLMKPEKIKKELIYGGDEGQKRTDFDVFAWNETNIKP